nr:flagellar protein FliT [Pseudomonas sp.]
MNAAKRLEETGSALREAMIQQDWTAISVLDLECREVVDAAMGETRRDEPAMRQRME